MTFSEVAVPMGDAGTFQLGILAQPEIPAQTGVVVVVGGPQYRAGSHRQFVLLSRALAQAGFAVLRLDYQGMGDSDGAPYDFTHVSSDIARAIEDQMDFPGEIKVTVVRETRSVEIAK